MSGDMLVLARLLPLLQQFDMANGDQFRDLQRFIELIKRDPRIIKLTVENAMQMLDLASDLEILTFKRVVLNFISRHYAELYNEVSSLDKDLQIEIMRETIRLNQQTITSMQQTINSIVQENDRLSWWPAFLRR